MDKYILDTNIFFNMEERIDMGKKTEEVIKNITNIGKNAKSNKALEFFMPPRAIEEFLSFFVDKNQPLIKNFLSQITVQSPDINKITFSASIFYQLIEDIRGRSYRGLRVGEEEINQAGKIMMGKQNLQKKDFEITIGKSIKGFRQRYRQATRVGFLDSLADLDLIMLTKQLNGVLVTTDEGVTKWGRVFGVKEMKPSIFGEQMKRYLFPHRRG